MKSEFYGKYGKTLFWIGIIGLILIAIFGFPLYSAGLISIVGSIIKSNYGKAITFLIYLLISLAIWSILVVYPSRVYIKASKRKKENNHLRNSVHFSIVSLIVLAISLLSLLTCIGTDPKCPAIVVIVLGNYLFLIFAILSLILSILAKRKING